MPDRIVAGLTFRQLAILAVDGLLIWLSFLTFGASAHPAVFAAVATLLGAVGLALATSTPEGIGVDKLALLAGRFILGSKRQVLAPEGLPPSDRSPRPLIGPIEVPIYDVTDEGLVDLGGEGFASLCMASGVNLALRSEREQELLVEAFARFLNSLTGSVQVVVASRRVDLTPLLADLSERATTLAHPALRRGALQHISFLENLAGQPNIRRRDVLVCFREAAGSLDEAGVRLRRRIDEAASLLRGIGVILRRLNSAELARYLRACADPEGPHPEVGCDVSSSTVTGGAR